MTSQDNRLGEDPHNNPNLPPDRVMKEEPTDDYGEGMDKDSRISHLMERLIESEMRARKAEEDLEVERASGLDMMEKTVGKFTVVRANLNRKLEESVQTRVKLEESFKREKMERDIEIDETKKRQVELKKENENLEDRLKKLTEQSESRDVYLAETRSKLGESESRSAQLDKELVDQRKKSDEEETKLKDLIKKVEKELMDTQIQAADVKGNLEQLMKDFNDLREINGTLATTASGKIYEELSKARKRIEQLEKKAEVVTPKTSNVRANKRKRTEEHPLHTDDSNEIAGLPNPIADSLDNLSTIPNFTHNSFPMKRKKEPVESKEETTELKEETVDTTQAIPDIQQISALDSLGDEMELMGDSTLNDNVAIDTGSDDVMEDDLINKEGDNEESIDHTTDTLNGPIDDELIEREHENEKRSSGSADSEPPARRLRSASKKEKGNNEKKSSSSKNGASAIQDRTFFKTSDTELECLECDYATLNAGSYVEHLRKTHSTTPFLAGIKLRCECGDESASNFHWRVCPIANFSVIRTSNGPIRRLNDPKTTPKCVLCETYPQTPLGYIAHLHKYHKSKSTLNANGIAWLTCGCGLEVRSRYSGNHSKECNHREFSIHRLDEK